MSDAAERVQVLPASQAAWGRAATWLDEGGLLVLATETLYGLAADPWSVEAVEALREAKRRPEGLALPLIAGDEAGVSLAAPGWDSLENARELAAAFWPGPLALVLDGTSRLAPGVRGEDGTVAIRVSPHPDARGVAQALGRPIIATSANRSGRIPANNLADALRSLEPEVPMMAIDGGLTRGGVPSTIVDPRGPTLRLVREGALPYEDIQPRLGGQPG